MLLSCTTFTLAVQPYRFMADSPWHEEGRDSNMFELAALVDETSAIVVVPETRNEVV